ncbi:hypothetical protein M2138_000716 [Dysgonomonadaceae bacterium PH5-43]|nr:hypothetical protein [Dysgonomonadaceae bacterium PH5-43]
MVLIYFSGNKTSRLRYIAKHIFNNVLGVEFDVTDNKKIYSEHKGVLVNYSDEKELPGIQITPNGLLSESNVSKQADLHISKWKDMFVFFANDKGLIPFDLFAASFYLLTLYEEHFPEKLDEHGRFRHIESLLYKNNVLEKPIVDRWAYALKDVFEQQGYDVSGFKLRQFRMINTFDIDHPFLYRNKGLVKNVGGVVKDLLKRNFAALKRRALVQVHIKEDPYFEALKMICETHMGQNKPYYLFVLLGERGKYGRTTLYSVKRYYDYIKTLKNVTIGLHPSYKTFRNLEQLMKEKIKLEKILGYKVGSSRQHFLRMQSPETFQELNLAGIKEDFSLAFAHAPGFRSGTAIPYNFYDIRKDEETQLFVRPTVMMDSTLIVHQKLTPQQGFAKISQLIEECKKSGGDYLGLWHNSNLAGSKKDNPWIEVFESFVSQL